MVVTIGVAPDIAVGVLSDVNAKVLEAVVTDLEFGVSPEPL